MKRTTMLFLFLPIAMTISCSPPVQQQPVNHVARFTAAATPSDQMVCLRDIVALGAAEAATILKQLDAANGLLAVDDQLNLIYHANADGTTYQVSPNTQGGSSKIGDGLQLEEVRWLGWSDGEAFGFAHHRYSIFVGKRTNSNAYAIFFVVFEEGKRSGLNAGELRGDHYEVLNAEKIWPADWRRD